MMYKAFVLQEQYWHRMKHLITLCVYCCLVTKLCPTNCDPCTVAHQAPLSMKFSKQERWSGLPFPSSQDLPRQGSNPGLPHCRRILYQLSHKGSPWKESQHQLRQYIKKQRHYFTDKDLSSQSYGFSSSVQSVQSLSHVRFFLTP